MNEDDIRYVAESAAACAVYSLEFQDVVEESNALEVRLTEEELRRAYRLALDAKVVMPGD